MADGANAIVDKEDSLGSKPRQKSKNEANSIHNLSGTRLNSDARVFLLFALLILATFYFFTFISFNYFLLFFTITQTLTIKLSK